MELSKLKPVLEKRLSRELPAARAHDQMAPRAVRGGRISFRKNEKTRSSGVLILLYEHEGKVSFPLIQRPTYDGVHSGQVSFPGGKWEPGDLDTVFTAKRETEEEIGVAAQHIEVIGNLSEFFVGASNNMVLPVVGTIDHKPVFKPDQHEVSEVLEASVETLLDDRIRKEKIIEVGQDKFQLHSPYFEIQGRVVWGATAMMLSEFKEILKEIYGY